MNTKTKNEREGVRKPNGGFCLIRGTMLLRAWEAYRNDEFRLMDLRVWFACWEAVARRCAIQKGRVARFRIEEIQQLIGAKSSKHVRLSIARFARAGLVQWSDSSITMLPYREETWSEDFEALVEQVTNHRRPVPVPRRIIRFLAKCGSKVMIATILGLLLRCLYYKRGLCLPEGTCKSSWIAEVFAVDVRNVKSARKELVSMGWITAIATSQMRMNRFGGRVRINLEWSCNEISSTCDRSLQKHEVDTGSPLPNKNKKLSTRSEQPETRSLGPAGFEKQKTSGPTLRNVRPDDLRSSTGLDALFREAVSQKFLATCEANRLKFFAAAEHAQTIAKRNACGLFATMVRNGLSTYLSHAAEDRAWVKLKHLRESGRLIPLHGVRGSEVSANGATCLSRQPTTQRKCDKQERAEIRKLIKHSLGLEDSTTCLNSNALAA